MRGSGGGLGRAAGAVGVATPRLTVVPAARLVVTVKAELGARLLELDLIRVRVRSWVGVRLGLG